MRCGVDYTLALCIVPSDEDQLGPADEDDGGANPARVNFDNNDVSQSRGQASGAKGNVSQNGNATQKDVPRAPLADAPTSLRAIPSDALHNLLLFCGPQSVTTGLGSTSKHYRSLCLTSGDSDAVWKVFFKWRCSSKLVLGHASFRSNVRSAADPHRRQEENDDELMPSRQRRREFQSSARLSSWNASSKSFENGKLTPEEPYYSIYRRLHLEGKRRENKSGVRCNRSRVFVRPFAMANPIAADDDPTLHEIEAELMQDLANFAEGIDPNDVDRLCNSDAVEWCDSPSCRRARCMKCLGSQHQGARRSTIQSRLAPSYIGNIAAKCDYCAISLCKGIGGCANNNLRHCDSCNRGVCLDCDSIVSNDPLGAVRRCKGQSGKCGQYICWRCARTVGRSKLPNDESRATVGGQEQHNISDSSIEDNLEEDTKMSQSEPAATARSMDNTSPSRSLAKSKRNGNSDSKFEALRFASEKQFADATGQTLCEGCANEKVGKLNMYRRLEMSPRI